MSLSTKKYGIDLSVLINEDHILDDVLSLETDGDETQEDWEDHMASILDLSREARENLQEVSFLKKV